jgi:hypothetical protein
MTLPDGFWDDDKNWAIRLCLTLEDVLHMEAEHDGERAPGSLETACDSCEATIIYDPSQAVESMSVELDGEVRVCTACGVMLMMAGQAMGVQTGMLDVPDGTTSEDRP